LHNGERLGPWSLPHPADLHRGDGQVAGGVALFEQQNFSRSITLDRRSPSSEF